MHKLLTFFMAGAFLTSCSTSDDTPVEPETENYADGTFILNEGNWGSGNASITYLDIPGKKVTQQVFKNENNGKALGDVGQSMAFYNEFAFIVLNASNTIEVVNRHTFESVASIDSDLANPRYIAFSDGKAFVSNWGDGSNPDDDFITVLNAEDLSLVNTISVAEGPEKVISGSGKIFVAHAGGHNINDIISVIDPVKNNLTRTITVGDMPDSMAFAEGFLWVLSAGAPAYTGAETAGQLNKIELATLESVQEMIFPTVSDHPANLEQENGILYYTEGNGIYSFETTENTLPETPVFAMEGEGVLYGFEVEDSKIFATRATTDFTGNGKLWVYDLSGAVLDTYDTGINPNGIYFNK